MAENDGGVIFRGGVAFTDGETERVVDGEKLVDLVGAAVATDAAVAQQISSGALTHAALAADFIQPPGPYSLSGGTLVWAPQHRTSGDPVYGDLLLFYAFKWTPEITGKITLWPGQDRSTITNEDSTVGVGFSTVVPDVAYPILGGSLFSSLTQVVGAPAMPPFIGAAPGKRSTFTFQAGTTYLFMVSSFYAADRIGKTVTLDGFLHSLNALGGFTNAELPPLPPILPYRPIVRDGETVALVDPAPAVTTSGAGLNSVSLGAGDASSSDTFAVGAGSVASAGDAVAIGKNSKATGASTVAVGSGAEATISTAGTAIGNGAKVSGGNSTAIGAGAEATANLAVALGRLSKATSARAAALQSGALADRAGVVIATDGGNATLKHSQTWERASSYSIAASTSSNPEVIGIADGSLQHTSGILICRRKNLAAVKVFKFELVAEKIAGVARFIGTPTVSVFASETGADATNVTITMVSNSPQLNLFGTAAGETIWGIHWRTEEIRGPLTNA